MSTHTLYNEVAPGPASANTICCWPHEALAMLMIAHAKGDRSACNLHHAMALSAMMLHVMGKHMRMQWHEPWRPDGCEDFGERTPRILWGIRLPLMSMCINNEMVGYSRSIRSLLLAGAPVGMMASSPMVSAVSSTSCPRLSPLPCVLGRCPRPPPIGCGPRMTDWSHLLPCCPPLS
jgi:hypothetical protein